MASFPGYVGHRSQPFCYIALLLMGYCVDVAVMAPLISVLVDDGAELG